MTDVQEPTIGDIVVANPATARILDGFGLDYCCHGDRSLADACAAAEIDVATVASALATAAPEGDTSWSTLDPAGLVIHIVETHHRYLWDELPLLKSLAAKVRAVHGDRHAELAEVHDLVGAVQADLLPHLMKEEQVLFPAITELALGEAGPPLGWVAMPIQVMLREHDQAGALLARLRDVTSGYTTPDDGCASYRSLYERLAALELDTHVHIHKENHVLFPAALRLAGVA